MRLIILLLSSLFCTPAVFGSQIKSAPDWSTPARGQTLGNTATETKQRVVGSEALYTQSQIDNKFNAPDWFPSQHTPMPNIVKYGKKPAVWACASCHLASGIGHPESSTLAGLSSTYITAQLKAFASGERLDYSGHMNRMALQLSTEDIAAAANYFASLSSRNVTQVIEATTVPVTYIDDTRMRLVLPDLQTEITPTGSKALPSADAGHFQQFEILEQRIIEVPKDLQTVKLRHPNSQFISYVPLGSIEQGRAIVETGDQKTTPCAACHGKSLRGDVIAPSIAGKFGIYTVRQLHGFQSGSRKNPMMHAIVQGLSSKDIVNIAAYLASLNADESAQ